MKLKDLLLGRPLATADEGAEHIGPSAGISIFGLDALSSAAYGPEAALTLLIPLGLAGIHFIVPVIAAILFLLTIVFFSYRQTIDAYPGGGGSFTVASENLGAGAGLLAAAALMIDYVLTAAVGISAGVGALVSAFPILHPHILALCLLILVVLTLVNLRGVKDSGAVFLAPTYIFLGTLITVIVVGMARAVAAGGHPVALVAAPAPPPAVELLTWWLMLKVFASGCAAMTGVEAVSNGVTAFREPAARNAKLTLTIIVILLMVLLAGIALLCRAYGIGATIPEGPGYESVLSQLIKAVMGKGIFYYLSMGSILLVLSLSANTAFADFPRLTRAIALHDYLPHVFILRGRRLLFSHGIYALVGLTAVLLIIFGGVTDRLIPLYAIGAFLAFTLSQAGMVMHWKKQGHAGNTWKIFINGFGAIATGVTLVVVLVAKFTSGAWVTVLLAPALILVMRGVKRHYEAVSKQIADAPPIAAGSIGPYVLVPMDRWTRITRKALAFAMNISSDVEAFHVHADHSDDTLEAAWKTEVLAPLQALGKPLPRLVIYPSPFRFVVHPILEHALELEKQYPDRLIAVVLTDMVVAHWWQGPLHNQRSELLNFLLMRKGKGRIVVINVPWYIEP